MYDFSESTKSGMQRFEEPHAARVPQFGPPWFITSAFRGSETEKRSEWSKSRLRVTLIAPLFLWTHALCIDHICVKYVRSATKKCQWEACFD